VLEGETYGLSFVNYGVVNLIKKDNEFKVNQKEILAFISVKINNGLKILPEIYNVLGITDCGIGDFSINFSKLLEPKMMVVHPVGATPKFEVVSISRHSVHLKFQNEPTEFKVRIDAPIEEQNQLNSIKKLQ